MIDSINSYVIEGFMIYPSSFTKHFPKDEIQSEYQSDTFEMYEEKCNEIIDYIYTTTSIRLIMFMDNDYEEYDDYTSIYIGICKSSKKGVQDPYTNRIYNVTELLEKKITDQEEIALESLREYLELGHDYKKDVFCITSVCCNG